MTLVVPTDNLVIDNAKLIYRNFAGAAGPFNAAGVRSFSVRIETVEEAQALEALGWKIKYTKPREDGEPPAFAAHLPVSLKYHPKVNPPRVRVITSRGQTNYDEEAIDVLDYMDIAKVDLIIRPFHWKLPSGSEGVKNMLSSIYITIREDELELRYADVPMIGQNDRGSQRAIESSDTWDEPLQDLGEIHEQKAIGGF